MSDYTGQIDSDEKNESTTKRSDEIKQESSGSEDVKKENNINQIWLEVTKTEDVIETTNPLYTGDCEGDHIEQSTVKLEDFKDKVCCDEGHREDNVIIEISSEHRNIKNKNNESSSMKLNMETLKNSDISGQNSNFLDLNFGIGPNIVGRIVWYQCKFCEYKTKQKYLLIRHFKTKHDESSEWLKCDSCEYKTKMKLNLKRHINRHNQGTKLYHCHSCEYETNDGGNFSRHVKSMHDENAERHHCHLCEYKSKHRSHLRRHLEYMHGKNIEYHQCEFCEFKTKSKYNLKAHIECKHEENPKFFECHVCGYKTKFNHSLVRHLKRLHNVTKE